MVKEEKTLQHQEEEDENSDDEVEEEDEEDDDDDEEEEGELALWSPDVHILELHKERDKGLGFSILDYQVRSRWPESHSTHKLHKHTGVEQQGPGSPSQ